MDDYFQILIIVFFIVSSLVSSINKKKKKQAKKTSNLNREKSSTPVKKQQKSSADLLEQILGLKMNLPEPPVDEAPPINYSDDNLETWNPESDFDLKGEDGISDYSEKISSKKFQLLQDKEKHRAFKKETKIAQKEKSLTVKQKIFAEHSRLKDYIIIQEVLNKPKALRR